MEPDERAAWSIRIKEAAAASFGAKALVENLVIDARKAGASWAVIGVGLGVSRQAAMERFSKLPELREHGTVDEYNNGCRCNVCNQEQAIRELRMV